VLLLRGRADLAIAPLERALKTCQTADARLLGPVPAGFLAWARTETGAVDQGVGLARQAVEDAVRMGMLASQPLRLAILARAHLAGGALDEALVRAQDAQDLARSLQEPGAEAYALRQHGEVKLRQGRAEDGRTDLKAALALAAALGLRPLEAECRRLLGAFAG
jgi:ATP/maltotriose-dependent transcriptional regulator MalT